MPEARGDSSPSPADPEAWLQAHGDRLLRSACLLCGNPTEAQDLVQETLLQALKSAHRFRGESAIYTWLHGILLNVNRRHWRKQKRLVLDEGRVREEPAPPEIESSGDREFHANRLAQALQTLSPEHREVVVLRFFENMKLQAIADQTGASLGTVKSRLHYALRCLERELPAELNQMTSHDTHDPTSA